MSCMIQRNRSAGQSGPRSTLYQTNWAVMNDLLHSLFFSIQPLSTVSNRLVQTPIHTAPTDNMPEMHEDSQ